MFSRGERYRLSAPTIGVRLDDHGQKVAVMLPGGAIVELVENAEIGGTLLVDWNGNSCHVFSEDLRTRGALVVSSAEPRPRSGRQESKPSHGQPVKNGSKNNSR